MNKIINLLPQFTTYATAPEAMQVDLKPQGETWAPLANLRIPNIISGLITLSLVIVALVFLAMLIMGGIRWITSRGDKTEIENARNQITHALIGLAIIFVAWAILALLDNLFGVDITSLTIPSFQGI